MFKTKSMCLISGNYSFVRHTDQSPCMLKHEEVIYLEKGDVFPTAKECGNSTFWVLCRENNT